MSIRKDKLKISNDTELLSYIINSNPVLSAELDLPVQGQSIKPYGKLISDNERYRNAFINTVNLIGLTLIKRNYWDNPWDFAERGTLTRGQSVRELINDLCNVYDYNENLDNTTRFLENAVPNVLNYIHSVNYQKFYEVSTSDEQLAMAFDTEGSLFDYVENCISMLYESKTYDDYIINKYMLCRRILDGTVPAFEIEDYDTKTARERVAFMKNISNKMTFRSPNFNPAGVRRATNFNDQIFLLNTEFEADMSTEVLATSFFRDDADLKARAVLCDDFGSHDSERLKMLLDKDYTPFTSDELMSLKNIPAVIISREWFMNYNYSLDANSSYKMTEFYNPVTLRNNHFLHTWGIKSTSPFENCAVFTAGVAVGVTDITVSPSTITLAAGLSNKFNAVVETTGFCNKAVVWSITKGGQNDKASIMEDGTLKISSDYDTSGGTASQIEIKATSIYDNTKSATAVVTVV